MKNRKGFTLIELLAVIVILAILMVAAGAAVISTMNNARANTFKDEALQVIDSAKLMFTDESMSSGKTVGCYTLGTLVDNGYLEKDLGTTYKGVVKVVAPTASSDVKYYVKMTNGTFFINNKEKNTISALKRSDIAVAASNEEDFSDCTALGE